MTQTKTSSAYIELHIIVFIYGFAAILGDLINMSAYMIVWWRVLLAFISLIPLIKYGKSLKNIEVKYLILYAGIGVVVALHWLCFYGSIKYANASIALITMATLSFFTAILEPVLLKTKLKWIDIGFAILIIPAMKLIVDHLDFSMMTGFWLGLGAAFLMALFTICNKKMVNTSSPETITFMEMLAAWLFLTIVFPVRKLEATWQGKFWPEGMDWVYILLLVLVCTTLTYVWMLKVLKHVSAYTANLVFNMEPVYGILLAILLLKEHRELDPRFYVGVIIIIFIVFLHPYISKKLSHDAT